MKHYALLTRPEYFAEITKRIRAAKRGERIFLTTMAFDIAEPPVAGIVTALQAAAHRRARVTVLVDALNFLVDSHGIPGPLLVRRSLEHLPGKYGRTYATLEALRAAGGSYRIMNIPKHRLRLPVSGRSHLKGAVIGNQVFIGGCNLERPEQLDLMVTWDDQRAADTLAEWFERIAYSGQTREAFGEVDVETQLDNTTRLLLDAGVPGQSLIYDEALRVISEAKEWLYLTCQYFPGGLTAKQLAAAQARGVRVEIDYSHPKAHGSGAALQRLHQMRQHVRHLPRNFFAGQLDKHVPKLHAKILASEHEILVGSHNYVAQGVQLGTAELALHSTDTRFINDVHTFMRSQLNAVRAAPSLATIKSSK